MPQLEDNIYVKFIAYFMGNNGLYQVYSCIELFDVGLWCLHEIKITLFSIVLLTLTQCSIFFKFCFFLNEEKNMAKSN